MISSSAFIVVVATCTFAAAGSSTVISQLIRKCAQGDSSRARLSNTACCDLPDINNQLTNCYHGSLLVFNSTPFKPLFESCPVLSHNTLCVQTLGFVNCSLLFAHYLSHDQNWPILIHPMWQDTRFRQSHFFYCTCILVSSL